MIGLKLYLIIIFQLKLPPQPQVQPIVSHSTELINTPIISRIFLAFLGT